MEKLNQLVFPEHVASEMLYGFDLEVNFIFSAMDFSMENFQF